MGINWGRKVAVVVQNWRRALKIASARDARVDDERRAFLGFADNLKAIADYETGPGSEVAPYLAADAIRIAKRFVAKMAEPVDDTAGGSATP